MNLREEAKRLHSYGLSVVPCGSDKRPKGEWKKAQYERIEPNGNFDSAWGLGFICGAISGDLEVIDIDLKYDLTGTLYQRLKEEIRNLPFVRNFVVEETQNGGIHFFYRCDIVEGNQAFARRHTTESERLINPKEKTKVLIESRGEGGFIVTAPSEGYKIISRTKTSFADIPKITPQERDTLIAILKTFDETGMWAIDEPIKKLAQQPQRIGVSTFDDYNLRGDIPQLLEDNDWRYVETHGNNMRYKRPGTTDSRTSADWHTDKRLLYVFTSSTEFEPNRGYNAVQVYTMLTCGSLNRDTYREASKELFRLGYGEQEIQEDEIEKQIELEKTNHYLASDDEIDRFLDDVRNDKILMGVGIGMPDLDSKWLYKPNSFNMIGGLSNVGKTDAMMWWFTQLSIRHDFNWLICSTENEVGELIKIAMEYYVSKQLRNMGVDEFSAAREWAKEHFTVFSNKRTYTYHEVLNSAREEMTKKAYAGLFIDPQSGLELDTQELKLYGEYRYHYRSATQFRLFTKQTGCSIYLVAHPNTEANKRMKDGFAQAPIAADIEFGSMWQNRCDNSITLHRIINHPTEWAVTEWHVRKIKSKFTGGDITSEPIRLRRDKNCFYTDEYNRAPSTNRYEVTKDEEDSTPF